MTMQKTWKKPRLFLGQTGQNKLMGLIPQNSAVFQIFNKSVLTVTVAFNILRKAQGKKMGEGTTKLLNQYRKVVPYVSLDRTYTPDINNGVKFLHELNPSSIAVK